MYHLQDSWDSMTGIIDYYAKNQDTLIKAAGPGHWNDPDEVCPKNLTNAYNSFMII